MRSVGAVLRDLEALELTGDYMSRLYDLTDELEAAPDRATAADPVFQFLEQHPDDDLGNPGPLVHFLEILDDEVFKEALSRSLSRRPVPATVWMLNRLINSLSGNEQTRYIEVMRLLATEPSLDESVRQRAVRYLEFQAKQ